MASGIDIHRDSQAVTLFLYGPEAALKMQAASTVFGADSANSKARADTWGIDTITPACIAMAAVMVSNNLCSGTATDLFDCSPSLMAGTTCLKRPKGIPYRRHEGVPRENQGEDQVLQFMALQIILSPFD